MTVEGVAMPRLSHGLGWLYAAAMQRRCALVGFDVVASAAAVPDVMLFL
jgi:hypothetical protein